MKELGWKSGKAVRILYTPYLCGVLDSARLTFVSKMLATAALLADVINDAIPKNTTALAADGHVLSEARQVDNVDVFYGASYPFRFEIVAAVECLKSFGCDHAYIRYWFLTHTLLYIYSKNPHQDCIRVLQMDELTKAYHASLEWDIEHYRHVATSMVRKSVERMSAPSDNQALEVPPVPAELIVANLDAIMEIMPDLYAWRGRE